MPVSCCETASTAKLDALGGGLFLNFSPPGGAGLSLVTFAKMACVATRAFELTKTIYIFYSDFPFFRFSDPVSHVMPRHATLVFSPYGSLLTTIF